MTESTYESGSPPQALEDVVPVHASITRTTVTNHEVILDFCVESLGGPPRVVARIVLSPGDFEALQALLCERRTAEPQLQEQKQGPVPGPQQ